MISLEEFIKSASILEFNDVFTGDELKKKYRQLAKQNHPDLGGSAERFKDINDANSKLSKLSDIEIKSFWFRYRAVQQDKRHRRVYDRSSDNQFSGYDGSYGMADGVYWNEVVKPRKEFTKLSLNLDTLCRILYGESIEFRKTDNSKIVVTQRELYSDYYSALVDIKLSISIVDTEGKYRNDKVEVSAIYKGGTNIGNNLEIDLKISRNGFDTSKELSYSVKVEDVSPRFIGNNRLDIYRTRANKLSNQLKLNSKVWIQFNIECVD